MLPLSDGVAARRFPVVNVLLIVANFAVWIFYELPHLNAAVYHASFYPCTVDSACRGPERGGSVGSPHVQAGEQVGEVGGNHVFQRHEAVPQHGQEPGQQRRHLHLGEDGGAGARIGDHDRQVERQPRDVRKRVGRVYDQRREYRVDPLAEQSLKIPLLVRRQLLTTAAPRSLSHPGRAKPTWRSNRHDGR
jgi:hypothetical protein